MRPTLGEGGASVNGDGPSEGFPLSVRHRLQVSTGLALAAGAGLVLRGGVPPIELLTLPLLLLFLPGMAFAQLPLLPLVPMERTALYRSSALAILAIGGVGLLAGWHLGGGGMEGLGALGLRLLPTRELLLWTLGLTGSGLLILSVSERVSAEPESFLARLLPRTPAEKREFALLSLAAGIGEELAYRGYLLLALPLVGLPTWGGVMVSALAFGVLHSYQGGIGVLRTGVVGLLFSLPLLLTGSLIPSILAHTLVDLIAGLILGPRWLSPSLVLRAACR